MFTAVANGSCGIASDSDFVSLIKLCATSCGSLAATIELVGAAVETVDDSVDVGASV